MLVIARQVQKLGLSSSECQDFVAFDRPRRRFAIADGVSDGVYPGQWARIVANGCLTLPRLGPAELCAALPSWQNAWMQSLPDGRMPWYVQAKLKATGAFSTLASLEIESCRENRRLWRIFTIGDSCVFQVRKGRLIRGHPFTRENQFSNRVMAISAQPGLGCNNQALTHSYVRTGDWQPGDTFLLMTDAIAAYLLGSCQIGGSIHGKLPLGTTAQGWTDWVRAKQDEGHIPDDDVTLLEIRTK